VERPAKRCCVGLVAVGVQEQAVYDDDDDTWVPLSASMPSGSNTERLVVTDSAV